jgi:cysteine-rich repeat protein
VEECDLGPQNSNTGECTKLCKNAVCGDFFTQTGVEECDLGGKNSNNGACTTLCKLAVCGDGFIRTGFEPCDDGNQVNGDGCNNDCVVSGTPVFTQTFNGAANGGDVWNGVATDAAGNIYVAGTETTALEGLNGVVRKYDASGNVIWTQTHNGFDNKDDQFLGITVDVNGDVIAVGTDGGADNTTDILVKKFSPAGNLIWQLFISTQGAQGDGINDIGFGVATNGAGDVFIAAMLQFPGRGDDDIGIIKLDGADGNFVWFDFFDASGGDDQANAIDVDPSGQIALTGFITTAQGNIDVWVRKYQDNGASETILWTQTFSGLAGGPDMGFGVATDSVGNVIVTGAETVANEGFNVWVRKYDPNGATIWTQGYDNPAHKDDFGLGVATDSGGNVVVSGFEIQSSDTSDVWVRKYSPAGVPLWTQGYNGAANSDDAGNSVAVDSSGFVCVAGAETTSTEGLNGWLRKFAP